MTPANEPEERQQQVARPSPADHVSLDGLLDRALHAGVMSHEEICRAANLVFTAAGRPPLTVEDVARREARLAGYRAQLARLRALPVIEQRTPEWYAARNEVITASDCAQALGQGKFGTQREFFQKKCGHEVVEFNSAAPALRWGVAYEPVANEIYARRNGMAVHEFGLLRHPRLDYIGASPDGITDQGVMLEIKCPHKRAITGEIPYQYMVQMQFQLDVCGLDECDYAEFGFVERDYFAPPAAGAGCEDVAADAQMQPEAGVFAEYANPDRYVYKPLDDGGRTVEEWLASLEPGYVMIHAWRLKKILVQRVYRNQPLIDQKARELREVWDRVLRYKADRQLYDREVAAAARRDGGAGAGGGSKQAGGGGLQVLRGYSFL